MEIVLEMETAAGGKRGHQAVARWFLQRLCICKVRRQGAARVKLPSFPGRLNMSYVGSFSAFVPGKDSVQRCVEAKASHMIDNK